ncbi:MAG: hypothetical protein KC478_10480 [Bacteriovoracaceae bacterium]|nr:hypothetical protein [Bacteriovoracaceae bacterium]
MLKYFVVFLSLLISSNSFANDAVSQASEYAKRAMTELASDPPLLLLKNEDGKSRHEFLLGYLKLTTDDDATLTDGTKAQEKGSAKGYGFGYGYSHSFKERWAFFMWLQGVTVEKGNHQQTVAGQLTAKTIDFDALNLNLALGLSYEFFRDNDKHTLNVFGGPSLMYLDFHADIENYDAPPSAAGNLNTSLDFFFSKFIPTFMAGAMYEYKYFKNWEIAPYALGVIKLIDKCQEWSADRVSINGPVDGSSSKCPASGVANKGQIDIAPSFVSIGVKVNYKPWDLGFNVSSMIRNAIMRPDKEDKAEVEGVLFSLSKSWGDY